VQEVQAASAGPAPAGATLPAPAADPGVR
jgi:hypothetical protein